MTVLTTIIVTVLAGLLLAEAQGGLPRLAQAIVRRAAAKLPPPHDERWQEEWLRHFEDLHARPVSAIVYALRVYSDALEMRINLRKRRPGALGRVGRRTFDLLVAALALVLVAPLLMSIALAIRLTSPGPILIRETRLGKGGEPFTIYRFRTTRVDEAGRADVFHVISRGVADLFERLPSWAVVEGEPRLTPIGAALHRLTLDYLPALYNVLRGDMSFVGPFPGRLSAAGRQVEQSDERPGILDFDEWQQFRRAAAETRRELTAVGRVVWRVIHRALGG